MTTATISETASPVRITVGEHALDGDLAIPDRATAVVLFAHGSGSSRHSPRNQHVAACLRQAGLATLLMDLLTPAEEMIDVRTAELRFDIPLLADRLASATQWLRTDERTQHLPIGYFGASTGAAAALIAAAREPRLVHAVVSRGGRPDLAGEVLAAVEAPTLLIVGGRDLGVIELNEEALQQIGAMHKQLAIVPTATHLFEEPGTLDEVAHLATGWFTRHLFERHFTPRVAVRERR